MTPGKQLKIENGKLKINFAFCIFKNCPLYWVHIKLILHFALCTLHFLRPDPSLRSRMTPGKKLKIENGKLKINFAFCTLHFAFFSSRSFASLKDDSEKSWKLKMESWKLVLHFAFFVVLLFSSFWALAKNLKSLPPGGRWRRRRRKELSQLVFLEKVYFDAFSLTRLRRELPPGGSHKNGTPHYGLEAPQTVILSLGEESSNNPAKQDFIVKRFHPSKRDFILLVAPT